MQDDLYNDPILDKPEPEEVTEDVVDTIDDDIVDEDVEFVETDEMGDEKKDKAKLKQLREELKAEQAQSREHLTALQRARADYVNLKKELDEVKTTTKQKTTERVVEDFLPVLDSFDMAMGNKEAWEAVDKNWRVGVEYIYSQLRTALENHGIEAVDKVGVDFDHNIHESIELKDTDDATLDHKIEKVIQKGYKMGDRIIRPARVVVWKKK
jgi:molecular chaperone GrpE